jgi:hypothetical protein
LYVPTPLARQIAASKGIELPELSVTQYNRSARHRVTVQRTLIFIVKAMHKLGWTPDVNSIVSEREMRLRAYYESTLRMPDAYISFENKDGHKFRIAIEAETEPKSNSRLAAMTAGIAEILNGRDRDIFGAHEIAISLPSISAIERYRRVMKGGAAYEPHKRLGDKIVPAGGQETMPSGAVFVLINSDGEIEKPAT